MRPGHFRLRHVLVPLAASVLASGTVSATAVATTRATTSATTSALARATDAAVTTAASLAWHAVPVQAPAGGLGTVAGGATSDILSTGNITCLSTSDCIVAGDLEDQDVYPETSRAVIWHWDGKLWASQATGISGDAALVGTACASLTECWAMGAQYVGKGLATTEGVMEHYDGTTWSPVSLPGATGVALNGVSCVSASDCLAVGNLQTATHAAHALAYRWDGKTWSALPALSPPGALWTVLEGTDCFAANDCIAVGDADNSPTGSGYFFSERFNGSSWSLISMPNKAQFNLGDATYLNLSCPSSNSCLAAGSAWHYTHGEMGLNTLFGVSFSWDGSSWTSRAWNVATCFGLCPGASSAKSPLNYERFYYPAGASCPAPGDCWVNLNLDPIVADGDPSQGVLRDNIAFAHWNGTTFQQKTVPMLGFFSSVGCLPVSGGSWCIGLGETPSAWSGTGPTRQVANVSMVGGYFTVNG
jgi:hypothetical protein